MLALIAIVAALPGTLFLTGETGEVLDEEVYLLGDTQAGEGESILAPVVDPTGQSGIGGSRSWFYPVPFDEDKEFTADVTAVLEVGAQLQAAVQVTATLTNVGSDGARHLASDTRFITVTGATAQEATFLLPATGAVVDEGDYLRLTVTVEGAGNAWIRHGEGTESRIEGITLATLDSDGDGVGDTVERAQGTDPFVRDQGIEEWIVQTEVPIAVVLLIATVSVAAVGLWGRP